MSRSDQDRIADMLMAAMEIASVVERGRDAFDGDVLLRRAVQRNLEILGEAAKSVSAQLTASNAGSPGPRWQRSEIVSAITTSASTRRNSG